MTQKEWLQIGIDNGIIEPENLMSSDDKNDVELNLKKENVTTRNITTRKDGRYMCYAKLSTGRKAVYGKTPKEADDKADYFERQEKGELEIEEVKKPEDLMAVEDYSFGVYYQKWFIAKMNTSIKPPTLDRIEVTYFKYYKEEFSQLDIRVLNEVVIIEYVVKWIDESKKKSISRKEFSKIMQIVKEVYATYYDECILNDKESPHAIVWETVKRKIEEKVNINSMKKKEIALSDSERQSMEEIALSEKKIASLVWILVNYTGLRLGEITALTWQDIDLEEEILIVNKSMCKYFERDKLGNRVKRVYDIGTTKTEHSTREVPLTEKAIKVIKLLKDIHIKKGWYKPEQLICYNGRIYKARAATLSKELKKLCKNAGVYAERVHPHLLRKTVATTLHDAGMSTRDIADVLGHSDIQTTEQCYIISTELEKKREKNDSSLIKSYMNNLL